MEKTTTVLKSHLNHKTLMNALAKRPKILVIYCHGGNEKKSGETAFWFESVERPSVVEYFTESNLRQMFNIDLPENPFTNV